VLFTEPCALRGSVINLLQSSNTRWRIAYEGAELIGIVAAVQAGLGVTCLVANGDDLWGVPRVDDLSLPEPPAPVPVSLAVRERSSQHVARLAQSGIETALETYPFAA
jgi:DNA-binding transcriptional LysR family regulator